MGEGGPPWVRKALDRTNRGTTRNFLMPLIATRGTVWLGICKRDLIAALNTCLLAKLFAKFLRFVREVFQVFCKFSEVFGSFRTFLDLFGSVRMRWDALACVRIQLGGLGKVECVFGFLAGFVDVLKVF